jgi:hypothetical protein
MRYCEYVKTWNVTFFMPGTQITAYDEYRLGVPTTWRKLKEITMYPALARHPNGGILRSPFPTFLIPDPFIFMPNPKHFARFDHFHDYGT